MPKYCYTQEIIFGDSVFIFALPNSPPTALFPVLQVSAGFFRLNNHSDCSQGTQTLTGHNELALGLSNPVDNVKLEEKVRKELDISCFIHQRSHRRS